VKQTLENKDRIFFRRNGSSYLCKKDLWFLEKFSGFQRERDKLKRKRMEGVEAEGKSGKKRRREKLGKGVGKEN